MIGYHLEGRPVHQPRLFVSVQPDPPQHALANVIELTRRLHPEITVGIELSPLPFSALEDGALLKHVTQPTHAAEPSDQNLPQSEQEVRVASGVLQVLWQQGTLCPVMPLILLVHRYAAEGLDDQVGQPHTVNAQHLGGDHRVEDVVNLVAKIALHTHDIVIGAVKDLHRVRAREHVSKEAHVVDRQRVDDVVGLKVRELDETDLLLVVMKRVALGIYTDYRDRSELLCHPCKRFVVFHHDERGIFVHASRYVRIRLLQQDNKPILAKEADGTMQGGRGEKCWPDPRTTVSCWPLLFIPLAAGCLTRLGIFRGQTLGLPHSEVWGRLFVSAQVSRWVEGRAPVGIGDLLSAPSGRRFWPVDPATQLLAVPLDACLGDALGWAILLAILSTTAGLGAAAVARQLGASWPMAAVAGLLLQLSPLWLRHAAEGVVEVLALGPPMLALWLTHLVVTTPVPRRRHWAALLGASILVAASSPYYAIYALMALTLSWPLWERKTWRRLATAALLVGLGGLICALPFFWAEADPGGRLSDAWSGGYGLVPEPLVLADGAGQLYPAPPPQASHERGPPNPLHALWVLWPGGIATTLILLAGVTSKKTRPTAIFGLAWLAIGPGFSAVARLVGAPTLAAPLEWLLAQLPLTSLLGNESRMVAVPLCAAVVVLGSAPRRWALPALAVVLATGIMELPPLALPTVDSHSTASLWPSIEGPTVTWPCGDPPLWNPGVYPKENLWLAAHHGGAQAYDYGRGSIPRDAAFLTQLSLAAEVPVARGAAAKWAKLPNEAVVSDLVAGNFTRVLVSRRTLTDPQWHRAQLWLDGHFGPPIYGDASGAVWRIQKRD